MRIPSSLAPIVAAVALFAACLALHTRSNDFPHHRHPDEPTKVEQIITGRLNFHHPMLMLGTTRLVVDALRIPREEQAVALTGRWVSATFTALAVVALAGLAFLWRGWSAGIATGALLTLHHQLFELSHYMKEDSALLFGIALTFLAAFAYARRASAASAAFLGLTSALAVSGKYVGIVALVIALPLLWREPPERRGRRIAIFATAFAATFVIVNFPLVTHLAAFRDSFGHEMRLVVEGHGGMTRHVPHTQYWNVFVDVTTPAIWALLLIFLTARWRERRKLSRVEWIIIAFPFAYALALSFSPKSNDRYFLPATAIFTTLAAVGATDALRLLQPPSRRTWASPVLLAVLAATQLPSLLAYDAAFCHDDTADLIAWCREAREIPATAVILKDGRVDLPETHQKKNRRSTTPPVPQKVIGERYAADRGTLDELRAQGFTHVAIAEGDYGKFLLDGLRPQASEAKDFARRRAFYTELLRAEAPCSLAFERERSKVIYLHPGLRVYRIAP